MHGYQEVAKNLFLRTKKMVEKSGFREFYHPFTGQGMGARSYGWATLIVDLLESF